MPCHQLVSAAKGVREGKRERLSEREVEGRKKQEFTVAAGEKVQIAGMELCAGAVQSPRWRVSVAPPLRPDTGAIVALTRQLVGPLSGPPVAIKPWQEGLRRGLQAVARSFDSGDHSSEQRGNEGRDERARGRAGEDEQPSLTTLTV